MANIPVVDFSAYSSTVSHDDQTTTAEAIDNAFRTMGFVYLQNHGISQARVEECFEWVQLLCPAT